MMLPADVVKESPGTRIVLFHCYTSETKLSTKDGKSFTFGNQLWPSHRF